MGWVSGTGTGFFTVRTDGKSVLRTVFRTHGIAPVGVIRMMSWNAGADQAASSHANGSSFSSRDAGMRSCPSPRILIIAVDCNDRSSTSLRSSHVAACAYGCENYHMRLIVAV